MAVCNLERLSILLVEDNPYIQRIMESLLRHLGFGWVATASNGEEAIDFLKTVNASSSHAGVMGVDIILSDLVMSPINGLLLLRWVRASKDSPNRFMPFIMISGAADREYVESARDLGVTEFLAKPFSVTSIYQRVMTVIESNRQFVMSHDYFGPDRRRKSDFPPGGTERRRTDEKTVSIVYSADKIVKPKDRSDVWYFRLPNRLREKLGGGVKRGELLELPKELLEEAELSLERDSMDFADWAMNYLSNLSNVCTEALLKQSNRRGQFEQINLLAHELRGQGGTFGYPLITIFAKMLYDCTMPGCPETDNAVELVKAHIDAMRAVIRERIAGDGGRVGKEILKELRAAIKKHSNVLIK